MTLLLPGSPQAATDPKEMIGFPCPGPHVGRNLTNVVLILDSSLSVLCFLQNIGIAHSAKV